MGEGYRDDLAAAQARIAHLEEELARVHSGSSEDQGALALEHQALVRSIPSMPRTYVMTGSGILVVLSSIAGLAMGSSHYEHNPVLSAVLPVIVIVSMTFSVMIMWITRSERLRQAKVSERLVAEAKERHALQVELAGRGVPGERVRVGDASPAGPRLGVETALPPGGGAPDETDEEEAPAQGARSVRI